MAENIPVSLDNIEIAPGEDPIAALAEPAQKQLTEVEQRALAQGWVPQDQYQGNSKWRDAEEFLDRGELFSKIDEQNRRIKSTEKTSEELRKHLEKVRKTEFDRALASLKTQKKDALVEGDADAVVEIDDKIALVREQQRTEVQQAQQVSGDNGAPNPAVIAWMNRNPWYEREKAMKVYADSVGNELAMEGETNPQKILDEVERRVRKEFSHRFQNPNREKPGAVEGGGSRGSQGRDSFQLTDEETRVMKRFVKAGVLTEKEYIDDIKASRGA